MTTVVFKLADSQDVWVADLDAGTVKPVTPPAGSDLDKAAAQGGMGKGVAFATVVALADDAFAGHVDAFSGHVDG